MLDFPNLLEANLVTAFVALSIAQVLSLPEHNFAALLSILIIFGKDGLGHNLAGNGLRLAVLLEVVLMRFEGVGLGGEHFVAGLQIELAGCRQDYLLLLLDLVDEFIIPSKKALKLSLTQLLLLLLFLLVLAHLHLLLNLL